MVDEKKEEGVGNLPQVAADFIASVIKKIRYRKKVRREVKAELKAHFADALSDCQNQEQRQTKAQQLIEGFGDAKLLAKLIRRGKKRCRPLWVQALAKVGQAAVLLIILFALYTAWFVSGKPNPRIDYMSVLNEMGRSAVSEEDNAWPMYKKAGELLVQPDEKIKELAETAGWYWRTILTQSNAVTDAQKTDLAEWIEENEEAWQHLVAGSLKRQFSRELAYTGEEEERRLRDFAIPLEPFRELYFMARWRVWLEIAQCQMLSAAQDCLVMVRVARSMQGEHNNILDHALAMLYSKIAYRALVHIAGMEKLTVSELKLIQDELAKIYNEGYPHLSMEEPKIMDLDAQQHIFTEGGPGGGHIIFDDLIQILKYRFDMPDRKTPWYMPAVALGAGMIHAGRDETLAMTNELWDNIRAEFKKTPYEREIVSGSNMMEFLSTLPKYRYFLVHSPPDFRDRADAVHQIGEEYEATMTIIALKRWQSEKGEYPENLEELTEECYLKQLPMDPYSDKPLVYRRENGDFRLYSVGQNLKDDGGVYIDDEDGRKSTWPEEGDTIFWPVE